MFTTILIFTTLGFLCAIAVGISWKLVDSLFLKIILIVVTLALFIVPSLYFYSWIYITKAIGRLMLPLGIIWIATGICTVILLSQRSSWLALFSGLLFIFITVSGNKECAIFILMTLEKPYVDIDPYATQEPYDVVIMLGGSTRYNVNHISYLGISGDRVMVTARLFINKKAKLLLVTATPFQKNGEKKKDSVEILTSLGIPYDYILTINKPHNTTDEMNEIAKLQKEFRWKKIGLVTSAWHMSRALTLAKKHNLHLEPLPADFRGASGDDSPTIIPTARGLFYSETAIWEYLGILAGR